MIKHRAMSGEQKQERRQLILAAAKELFAQLPYHEINLTQVAEKAGVVKGTLYLYFKTREDLFLELMGQELEAWFDEINTLLTTRPDGEAPLTGNDFAKILSGSFRRHAEAIRLIAISQSILEQNIDYATALYFKKRLLERIEQTGSLMEERLPFLKPDSGKRLILWIYMLVVGIQSSAEPAPVVQQTFSEPGLDYFKIDFYQEIERLLSIILNGMSNQSTVRKQ
jgi:TetR/AcrR family transcriptional regulator